MNAEQFQTFLARHTERARANPITAKLLDEGFTLAHTGGGCLALVKTVNGKDVVVTDEGGADFPESERDYIVGVYPEGDWNEDGYMLVPDDADDTLTVALVAAFEHANA